MQTISDEVLEIIVPVDEEELQREIVSFNEYMNENEAEAEAYRIVERYI